MNNEPITLNRVGVDWLSISTFDKDIARLIEHITLDTLKLAATAAESGKRMNYTGVVFMENGVFMGKGLQVNPITEQSEENYFFTIPGGNADKVYEPLSTALLKGHELLFNIPRLDLQWTCLEDYLKHCIGLNLAELIDKCYNATAQEWQGRKPVMTAKQGQVLWLGNRKSPQFGRIYGKDFVEKLVRFEKELKGMLAKQVFCSPSDLGKWFRRSWNSFHKSIDLGFMNIRDGKVIRVYPEPDTVKRLRWLETTVFPALFADMQKESSVSGQKNMANEIINHITSVYKKQIEREKKGLEVLD